MKRATLRIILLLIATSVMTNGWWETPKAWSLESSALSGVKKTPLENAITFGVYVTKDGDTLENIVGNRRIYGNPLKWPLIYFLNREELTALHLPPENLPHSALPAGLALAYLRPEEAQKKSAQSDIRDKRWVVNILSSANQRDIYPIAIKLMENGHFAYIAEWSYKGKNWKRLRTGFFKDQQAAADRGSSIIKSLNLQTFWIVEAEWKEVNEYIGFAECLLP